MLKIHSQELKLQQLSIPARFEVIHNTFYSVLDNGQGILFKDLPHVLPYELYNSILFQILYKPSNLLIDLGWGPALDPAGSFYITIIRTNDKRWEHPLVEFDSPYKNIIIDKLNELMKAVSDEKIQ